MGSVPPQWSPVVTTGTTPNADNVKVKTSWPQWSPVVTTGTTRVDPVGEDAGDVAAMEPRRDDGDDSHASRGSGRSLQGRNGAPS